MASEDRTPSTPNTSRQEHSASPHHPENSPDVDNDHPNNPDNSNVGNPNEDELPQFDQDQQYQMSLAKALARLSKALSQKDSNQSGNSNKSCKPDTFDSTDPLKLNDFILQCTLFFQDSLNSFRRDSKKVNFALSYLRGTALQWFEPAIINNSDEDWIDDWSAFIDKLKTNFGTIDPIGNAEEELDVLTMLDNQKIIKYHIKFNRLAARVEWDQAALWQSYYKGLPDCIKDIISSTTDGWHSKTLNELKITAQLIDAHYWERNWEKTRSAKQSDKIADKNKTHKNNNDQGKTNNTNKLVKPPPPTISLTQIIKPLPQRNPTFPTS